jgi:hypothetical protein
MDSVKRDMTNGIVVGYTVCIGRRPIGNPQEMENGESIGFISWGVPKGKIHNIDHM